MNALPAREQLTVFVAGVADVPGLTLYGLSAIDGEELIQLPDGMWPHAGDATPLRLHGDGWQVRGWDLPILAWPSGQAFQEAIRATLGALIKSGGCVAWVGAEGVPFFDPPELLAPECMSGGVLAWLTDEGWFGCPLDPDQPWSSATDHEMALLCRHAGFLAASIPRT